VRVSIYLQILYAIFLVYIEPTHELVKTSLRNSLVMFYAVALASLDVQTESVQQAFLIELFSGCLLLSVLCTLALQPKIVSLYYRLPAAGSVLTLVGMTVNLLMKPWFGQGTAACQIPFDSIGSQGLLITIFIFTGVAGVTLLIAISIMYVNYRGREVRKRLITGIRIAWISLYIIMIISAELVMSTVAIVNDINGIVWLNVSGFGLGQVMTLVMLAPQVVEISSFYDEKWERPLEKLKVRLSKIIRKFWFRQRKADEGGGIALDQLR
jgi:hypothetical protein